MSAPATVPPNAYTDAPKLHHNLILGSLQLFIWLFLHPSAWRNHLVQIDPNLRPDFALADLNRSQQRNPNLHRLLIQGYGIWFLAVSLFVYFGLQIYDSGSGAAHIAFGIMVVGLAVGIGIGVASNVAGGMIFSVLFSLAAGIVASELFRLPVMLVGSAAFGLAFGIAFGLQFTLTLSKPTSPPLTKRPGSIIISALIGGATIGLVIGIAAGIVVGIAAGIAVGIGGGVAIGLAFGWRTHRWRRSLFFGIALGMTNGLMFGVIGNLAKNAADIPFDLVIAVAFGALFSALFALPYVLAERLAGPWTGAVAGILGSVSGAAVIYFISANTPLWPALPINLISVFSGLTLYRWRPLLFYPFELVANLILYRINERRPHYPSLLRWHSAFWDEHQRLCLYNLDEYLLLIIHRNPTEGRAAIEYLDTTPQRWAAQAAQIEMEVRWLESCDKVEVIGSIHRSLSAGELTGPASALLRTLSRISQDVMAALLQGSAYNQRLALSVVEDRLDNLLRELTRSSEPYAVRFRPIATNWRKIIADHARELTAAVELRQEIDNPYVIGVPLTAQQEIFVGRTDISARIEQLLLDRRRPPLLLYGQRRMGKTSLLNNLGRLLPSTIVPLFIDLQGPASQAKSHTGFFYNIARGMINTAKQQRDLSFPPLSRERLNIDPFTYFDEWLDEVEQVLGQRQIVLVTLDEFEALDEAIVQGNLDGRALLNMLRHLIQHRPRFKILLTSSQTLDAFKRWSSYLINIQVVHISYLNEAETYQLIERPVKNFELRYEPEASRRVFALTRGHPFLVQLLCGEIVAHKNEQELDMRRLAGLADVEAVIPEALQRGNFFFTDIEQNQIDPAGVAILRHLARQGEGVIDDQEIMAGQIGQPEGLDQTLNLLKRRELIEEAARGYRFQVELIRRWFTQA